MTTPTQSFEDWKAACSAAAEDMGLCLGDLCWSPEDPFDLEETAKTAWEAGTTPRSYIAEIFQEELAIIEAGQKYADEMADVFDD